MVRHQALGHAVERGLDRRELGEDVWTIALVVDHLGHAPDLALDPLQALEQVIFVAHGHGVTRSSYRHMLRFVN
jgi:hypothetical protein